MTKNDRGLTLSVSLLCLLFLTHYVAIKLYFYWSFWWFDILMHILSAMAVSLTAFFYLQGSNRVFSIRQLFSRTIFAVLAISVLWEIYEFFAGVTFSTMEMYYLDTAIDLVMDIVGGFIGMAIAYGASRA
ncbi:MAG: hypothetical protein Q7S15_01805 [bacterium]|nr:hypothetical protein [bacterium]